MLQVLAKRRALPLAATGSKVVRWKATVSNVSTEESRYLELYNLRFDDFGKRFDDFHTNFGKRIDFVIAKSIASDRFLLAVMGMFVGNIYFMMQSANQTNSKLDEFESKIETRLDANKSDMDAFKSDMEAKLDANKSDLDAFKSNIEAKLDANMSVMDAHKSVMDAHKSDMEAIRKDLKILLARSKHEPE